MIVLGVTGHQGLPAWAAELVEVELPRLLADLSVSSLVCSLADGADQLCASIALSAGVSLQVVVPCRSYESTFDEIGLQKYRELLDRAADVAVLDFDLPSEAAFLRAGQKVVEVSQALVAVWDGQPAVGLGGTADIVDYASRLGKQSRVIWPDGLTR